MAFRTCSCILVLVFCGSYSDGCSDAQIAETNKHLQLLEEHQEAFKVKLDKMFENLDEEMKSEVGERLPGLLKTALEDLLKDNNLSEIMAGPFGEIDKMRERQGNLRSQFDETVKRIEIIETENAELENMLLILQNETSSLKETNASCDDELREVTPTTLPQTGEMTRILILPWGHTEPQQIDMKNHSLSEYPLERQGYQSVAYVEKNSSVLSTVVEPFGFGSYIYISDIDSGETTKLLKDQDSQGIAVDEDKELIFFSTSRPKRTVSTMTPDGSNVKMIADLSRFNYACSIALDINSSNIYVAATDHLLSLTYEGTDLKSVYTGSDIRAVTIDNKGGAVYFNDGTLVKILSLEDGTAAFVTDLSFLPWNFIYHEDEGLGVIYVSSFRRKKIGKVELTGNNTYVPILSGCSPCHHVTSMCLLP